MVRWSLLDSSPGHPIGHYVMDFAVIAFVSVNQNARQ
jgi:hypothetical protein